MSVSDKQGIAEFARGLRELGVEIISTGGTLALLKKHRVRAIPVTDYTGFPEILEGRVKTLHPKIHGGLLYLREKKNQATEARKHGILPIDMVVVNLYPFEETAKAKKVPLAQALEEIDIGGPAMLRAAAKNFRSVAVVSDPADYARILEEMKKNRGGLSEDLLKELAGKVFRLTSYYDGVISQFLGSRNGKELLPERIQHSFRKAAPLRYGENPHQQAALYAEIGCEPALSFTKLHGKELSYNNLVDLESAWDVVEEFEEPAACVIKHNTPCGVAMAGELGQAVARAIDCDPEASFGGIIGLNRPCDAAAAETIFNKLSFMEVIVAPSFAKTALSILAARKNLRLVEVEITRPSALACRLSRLGLLVQERDASLRGKWTDFQKRGRSVTKEKPTPQDLEELFFAWRCAKVVKSNGIVLAKEGRTLGIGAGQMSRVDAVKMACGKAGEKAAGSYLASDGFFPMADNIQVAASHGIRAIVQPGGSIRDHEVIEAADQAGIIMVFTGERHFRH